MLPASPATRRRGRRRFLMRPPCCPGKGLAQHPFLYTAEWDLSQNEPDHFVVRDGRWRGTYSSDQLCQWHQRHASGMGDATMLPTATLFSAAKLARSEITPDKKIIWNIDGAPRHEIHSIQPIGLDRVLVTQNRQFPRS